MAFERMRDSVGVNGDGGGGWLCEWKGRARIGM